MEVEINVLLVALVGAAIVVTAFAHALLRRVGLPPLVAFIVLGALLRLADGDAVLFTPPVRQAFGFLASMGLVALLFETGLRSHPRKLLEKLPSASLVWLGDVGVSGALGFLVAYYLLGIGTTSSLAVAAALTATSIGVSVPVWRDARRLDSDNGQLVLDVAELDDLSGILLMALLFAALPTLTAGTIAWHTLAGTAAQLIATLVLFAAFCLGFRRYAEKPLTRLATRFEAPVERMLTVAGVGFLIAAVAGWIGFSLAIGALFAGLTFSEDPAAVRTDLAFHILYRFFTPFFFIGIGLDMDPVAMTSSLGLGAVLLLTGMAGKFLGAGGFARLVTDRRSAVLIGLSMMPRAEIAMVIMHQARLLGAVPAHVYGAMVVVSAGTCLIAPLVLRPLITRGA